MARTVRRVLNISLEFTDLKEVKMALQKMQNDMAKGKKYERVMYSTSIMEWSCTKADEMDYTEEVINGQLCKVYQSSMNKKKKIKR
jgi:hypothetical protein